MRRKMAYGLAGSVANHGSTVVVVNRPLCPLSTLIKKPERMREFYDKPMLRKLDQNLFLFSPRYFIHDGISNGVEFLEKINLLYLRKYYEYLTHQLGIEEQAPIVWYHHPHQGYVTRLFSGSFNVFELYDNLACSDGNEQESVNRLERKYRPYVSLFMATSPKLYEKYQQYYENAWLTGNCLDRETYERLCKQDIQGLPELLRIPSPRIGYTGIISKRLDWDLIRKIAEQKPEWNFLFVGNVQSNFNLRAFHGLKNMHFPGYYDHRLMPAVLKSFDLGFMPYLDNEFFRYSNPLKFYEFAAADLRSVSSNMEILNMFPPEFVKIVPNQKGKWIAAIEEMLNSGDTGKIGQQIASKYIWEDMYAGIIKKMLAEFFKE
jgi:hypothetical protein